MAETKTAPSSVKGLTIGIVIGVIIAFVACIAFVYFMRERFEIIRDVTNFISNLIERVGIEGAVALGALGYAMTRDHAHGKRFDKLLLEFAKQRESDQKLIAQLARKSQ